MSVTTRQEPVTLTLPEGASSIHETEESERYHLLLGLSPEFNQVIEELALRYGRNKAEVINLGVCMFKFLSDAAREGKKVGVAAPDQELETEITEL